MAFTPDAPFPKAKGDDIRAKDWNDTIDEILRLDTAKLNQSGGHVNGPLTIAGNVGIGLPNPPVSRLEIVGSSWTEHLRLTNTGTGGAGPSIFFNAVNRDWAILGTNGSAGAGDQKLGFYDATSNAYRLVIDQNGNVGMGTVSPAVALHVLGNRIRLQKPGTTQTLDLRADGSAFDIESNGADLYLNNNNIPVRIRNLVQGSSREWKEDIAGLSTQEATHVLESLKPSSFIFTDDISHHRHLGFVAEEVPTSAATPDKKGYSPTAIIAVLTQVVKEQQQQLSVLQEEITVLKARVR